MTQLQITADSNFDSDSFGRARAAEGLLDTLTVVEHSQGAVVALQGAWGSGKSWMLHAAEARLEKVPEQQRPLWIQFSPWALSGSDALVEALLKEIAGQVKLEASASERAEKVTALGDRLLEYAENLSAIRHLAAPAAFIHPALGAAVATIGHGTRLVSEAAKDARPIWERLATAIKGRYPPPPAGRPALLELRRHVITALKELDSPLIVVLDDLDRMSPREVADIVQTVKAVANFPRVIYLLAFDPKVIAESLEQALSLPPGGGRRYLEKIVQITIDVPQPPRFLIRDATRRVVNEALSFANWSPRADFTDDLENSRVILHTAALMETPRDVNRLRIRLQITFRALRDEICPADLVLLEALRLKTPGLIDWIEDHHADLLRPEDVEFEPDFMVRGSIQKPGYKPPLDGDPSSIWRQGLISWMSDNLSEVRSAAVDAALTTLFDAYGTKHRETVRPFRVQNLRNWTRWLAQVGHEKILDNGQIVEILESNTPIEAPSQWPTVESFVDFDLRLRVFLPILSTDRLLRAAQLYLAAIDHFGIFTLSDACKRTEGRGQELLWPIFHRCIEIYPDDGFARSTFDAIFNRTLLAGFCSVTLRALLESMKVWSDPEAHQARHDAWMKATALSFVDIERCARTGDDAIELAFYFGCWSKPVRQPEEVLRPLYLADARRALFLSFKDKSAEEIDKLFILSARNPSARIGLDSRGEFSPASLSPSFIEEFAAKVPDLDQLLPELGPVLRGALKRIATGGIVA
jgi:hypothetical protein